ncbi:hypothetical protein RhiLY_05578 [Ceratobasidium sp. AG-Ba]|nr:hypothetical protein RhiLY_05578 [Ceratobasidium sp. AG-Ba]
MELEDDGPDAHTSAADREWNKLSNDFTNAGYREGITAGKEASLQAGFDDGFASVGAPLGRRVGTLRGKANAALALCARLGSTHLEAELRDITRCLTGVKLSALAPPDMQAIEHAKTHADDAPDVGDVEMSAQAHMDGLEEALGALSTTSLGQVAGDDPMARSVAAEADLARLIERLGAVCRALGI